MKPGGSDALRHSYEGLRTQVLHGGRGSGLAVFLHHGMREWIEVCCSFTPVLATIEATPATMSSEYMPLETRSEIVSILAGLFLQQQWEAKR